MIDYCIESVASAFITRDITRIQCNHNNNNNKKWSLDTNCAERLISVADHEFHSVCNVIGIAVAAAAAAVIGGSA